MDIVCLAVYVCIPKPFRSGGFSKFRDKHTARGMGEDLQNQLRWGGLVLGVGRRGENGEQGTI